MDMRGPGSGKWNALRRRSRGVASLFHRCQPFEAKGTFAGISLAPSSHRSNLPSARARYGRASCPIGSNHAQMIVIAIDFFYKPHMMSRSSSILLTHFCHYCRSRLILRHSTVLMQRCLCSHLASTSRFLASRDPRESRESSWPQM